jgi:ABC-type multidrug transport system fused ATPase/permease subunit
MAYVPQEVILFGGTIRENIAYGKPHASETEIAEAARKANAWNFIQSFPEGLQTLVGDRGIQLSGGQRQRIAIARAVLRDPAILILDEATSSLDNESEKLVQEALDQLMKGRTSLVIAHRLSTIRNADKIVVLEQGRVTDTGTHEELIARPEGLYRKLVELSRNQEIVV